MDPSQIDTEFDDLERRLLALTFTLPRQSDASALQSASVAALDVETMAAYLRSELNEAQLRAFESDIRGNPLRFAELIAFKDAYLGRPRALRQVVPRVPPPIERVEVGVLSIRRLGKRATLEWQGAESDDSSTVDFLKVAAMRRPEFDFRQVRDSSSLSGLGYPQDDRELTDLQEEMAAIWREVRSSLLMARKSGDLEAIARLAPLLALLDRMSTRQRELIRRLRNDVDAALEVQLRSSPPSEVEVMVDDHRLYFSSTDRPYGTLTLRIAAASEGGEFTWVRPGLDFTSLRARSPRPHRLSPVEETALLMVDEPGSPTRVVRVVDAGV